jgi:hypothetical protein
MTTTNNITGDRIVTKISKDVDSYGNNLEKIFGKRDFRNRPIKDDDNINSGSVTNTNNTTNNTESN